ncbi:UspA [Sesbania bispinosa]|nr:UspA [Sesbania bispinosa]
MDVKKIVVVVEDVDAARTALQWALRNIIRCGDIITLLHVYHSSRSKTRSRARLLRLNGFRLALSFQDICNNYSNTKVEIIVTEGDQEGKKIASTVREIGASMLVLGLHDHSFLYKFTMAHSHDSIASNFNCRVLAIKQPHAADPLRPMISAVAVLDSSTNMDFSQIDISKLE